MSMEQKLTRVVTRYEELREAVASHAQPGSDEYTVMLKELAELQPVVESIERFRSTTAEMADLAELVADPAGDAEMRALAEDDPDVMRVLNKTLSDAGFAVTCATNGDQALELFRKAPEPFALVITDIVMPGDLQGPKLARSIREIAPKTACIFISVHNSLAWSQRSRPSARYWNWLTRSIARPPHGKFP